MKLRVYRVNMGESLPNPYEYFDDRETAIEFAQKLANHENEAVPVATLEIRDDLSPLQLAVALLNEAPFLSDESEELNVEPNGESQIDRPEVGYEPDGRLFVTTMEGIRERARERALEQA